MVSLSPVSADEGYIPYFPDFLEPHGIGFRGPAEISNKACWTNDDTDPCENSTPAGAVWSKSFNNVRSFPITIEYRKNYLFKKLLFTQTFLDFGNTISNNNIKTHSGHFNHDRTELDQTLINSNSFLKNFLTEEEKSLLSSLDSSVKRVFDLKTTSNFVSIGVGIGLDLWFLEIANGFFLMYHETSVSLRSCQLWQHSSSGSSRDFPSYCQYSPNDIINLDKQNYSGFGYGYNNQFNLVFLQTNNWRISMEFTNSIVQGFFGKKVKFRELTYYPVFSQSTGLGCTDYTIQGDSKPPNSVEKCINVKGEDMLQSSDYTGGLKITYYFR